MPKKGYYALKLDPESEAHVRAICARLGLDADEWGAYAKAIKFALRLVALELVKDHDITTGVGGSENDDST
jgi:hypothetical protein